MTQHSAHSIAGIASRAGFTGASVAQAVAIAMHATQGNDAYDCLLRSEPLIHVRGLFGLSVETHAPDDRHKLYDSLRGDDR